MTFIIDDLSNEREIDIIRLSMSLMVSMKCMAVMKYEMILN